MFILLVLRFRNEFVVVVWIKGWLGIRCCLRVREGRVFKMR